MIAAESSPAAREEAERNALPFSLLYLRKDDTTSQRLAPESLKDLNINNIIESISSGNTTIESHLKNLLPDKESISYRQEIFRDLENKTTLKYILSFSKNIQYITKTKIRSKKFSNRNNEKILLLDLCNLYIDNINKLHEDLSSCFFQSDGLCKFNLYLSNYMSSTRFISLTKDTKELKNRILGIKYILKSKSNVVSVYPYKNEENYFLDLNKTFNKIIEEDSKDYIVEFTKSIEMNHIEAQILDLVMNLHPLIFKDLNGFYDRNSDFLDPTILQFEEDFNFYLSYVQLVSSLREIGLCFCYPDISYQKNVLFANNTFDLALALKSLKDKHPIICNDIDLNPDEKIMVISGPNQGGKTTFSRIFGQIHYLARLGCPIPGTEASLFFFDSIFTHFEKQETIENPQGKLRDELSRLRFIFENASSNSIIIINEIFNSTTLGDAISLAKFLIETIKSLDCYCAIVTFIEDIALMDKPIVSFVSSVHSQDPDERTFKIIKKPADGRAYAISIAKKYNLTYDLIQKRIKR
ncbi:MutS-related protein [Aminirod propionatiphilus]|uniref:DNA mismatch repair protein MutS n=1 Tax=Aminirod propionatiphilus TaxID=3415223 RepID=A0ACD1DVP2_9BACT|nr:DNA mismatch repair protein MutS [Synergistota bacterium]